MVDATPGGGCMNLPTVGMFKKVPQTRGNGGHKFTKYNLRNLRYLPSVLNCETVGRFETVSQIFLVSNQARKRHQRLQTKKSRETVRV